MDTLFNVIENPYNLYSIGAGSMNPGNIASDSFSGIGVSGDDFAPSFAGVGNFGVTYTYTDTIGCVNSIIDSTVVQEAAGTFYGIPSNNHYCIDAPADSIWALTPNDNGVNGTYTAATGIIDNGNDTVTFTPSLVPVGITPSPVTITYTYTGLMATPPLVLIQQYLLPLFQVLSFDMDTLFNVIESPYALTSSSTIPGNEDTSYYSGTGINGTNFEPTTAGVGDYTITYTYIDTIGCVNSITDHTIVQEASECSFGIPNNNYYCIDGAIDTLWAVADNIGAGLQGSYTSDKYRTDSVFINGAFADSTGYAPEANMVGMPNDSTISDTITYEYMGFDGTTFI